MKTSLEVVLNIDYFITNLCYNSTVPVPMSLKPELENWYKKIVFKT